MSRKATNEYIGTKRRAYAQADRAKRMRILDEVCETTRFSRPSRGPCRHCRERPAVKPDDAEERLYLPTPTE